MTHRLFVNLEKNGKVAFGSSGEDQYEDSRISTNNKKIKINHAAILPLHCELWRQEDGSLNLEVSQDATVYINGVPIVNAVCTLKAGDCILIGFSTLFGICEGENMCGYNFRFGFLSFPI